MNRTSFTMPALGQRPMQLIDKRSERADQQEWKLEACTFAGRHTRIFAH